MTPYDDPHVSAGEIADYLHSIQSTTTMSFTSPPDLQMLGLPQTLAQPLTKPNTSADIIVPRKIGTVNCINVARLGEPIRVRFFGSSAVGSATGQVHTTQAAAEADVLAWADGKVVHYEQHAVVPLGCQATCSKKAAPSVDAELVRLRNELGIATTQCNIYRGSYRGFADAEVEWSGRLLAATELLNPLAEAGNDLATQVLDKLWGDHPRLEAGSLPGLLARLRTAEAQVAKVYEVIDKEFDQHASDRDSNCTPEQAQFYQNCEGAIAMLRMHLEKHVPAPIES
ncbi:MAG: hypothetical protein ACRYG7_13055 [Janthinobacterium lividum]